MASFGGWAGMRQSQPEPIKSCRPALDECLPHGKPVFRLEKLHQGALQLAVLELPGDVHLLLRERVDSGVIPARRDVSGSSIESVHDEGLLDCDFAGSALLLSCFAAS